MVFTVLVLRTEKNRKNRFAFNKEWKLAIDMKLEEMKKLLEESIPSKRFKHSVAVYKTALELAEAHKLPVEKIAVAALLHDCGREVNSRESVEKARELGLDIDVIEMEQPILLHAKIGAYNAVHKYGVTDTEILDGILYHTTGAADMTVLAKVVYLADMLEPARDFPGIEELRKQALKDLDKAMLMAYANTIGYLLDGGLLIHPHCIEGYNQLRIQSKKK